MLVSVDHNTRNCYCCGRTHMRKTLKITYNDETFNIGVICLGLWFRVNMSGNVFHSIERLQKKLKTMSDDQIARIIDNIRSNSTTLTI